MPWPWLNAPRNLSVHRCRNERWKESVWLGQEAEGGKGQETHGWELPTNIYITCCLSYRWKCSQDLTEISQVTRKLLKRWTLWLTWIDRGFLWSWYWLFMIIRCCSMLFVDSLSSKAWASPQTKTSRLQRQAQIHFNQTFQTVQLVFILFFLILFIQLHVINVIHVVALSCLVFEDDIGLYESFWILILFDWVIEWYWMWLRAPLERFQI